MPLADIMHSTILITIQHVYEMRLRIMIPIFLSTEIRRYRRKRYRSVLFMHSALLFGWWIASFTYLFVHPIVLQNMSTFRYSPLPYVLRMCILRSNVRSKKSQKLFKHFRSQILLSRNKYSAVVGPMIDKVDHISVTSSNRWSHGPLRSLQMTPPIRSIGMRPRYSS